MLKKVKRKLKIIQRMIYNKNSAYPDFLIIGTQKGGTTSLYEYLIQNPGISESIVKEVHYYDINYEKGLKWYKAHFYSNAVDSMKGEASPYYLFNPLVPERIKKDSENIKFIVLLRDPVERAYSHYKMMVRRGIETLSFEDAIDAESDRINGKLQAIKNGEIEHSDIVQNFSYISRGIYVKQLEHWFSIFPKENFLILNSEEFYDKTEGYMRIIENFLGVKNWDEYKFEIHNSGSSKNKMNNDTKGKLEKYFMPYNEELYELIGERYNW